MRLSYISDQKFFIYEGKWYTTASFPLDELQKLFPFVDEWLIYGRLYELNGAPKSLYLIPIPVGVKVLFRGCYNMPSGFTGFIRNFSNYIQGACQAILTADIIWLKLPFIASLAYLFCPRKEDQVVIAQMVGDPVQGTLGRNVAIRFSSYVYAAFVRLIICRCDLPVFVSRYLASKYGRRLNTAYLIANESRILPQMIVSGGCPSSRSVPRILYVGRLSPEKGLNDLFAALKLLRKRISFEAVIVGDGILLQELKNLAARLGLGDNIHFVGPVVWGDSLFSIMRQCDVLVLPSKTEGLGLVLIEAMSQGLPVVATKVGGIPEIVEDRVSGLLVPPNSPEDLADALWDALFDQKLREKLIANGLKVASKNTFIEQTGKIAKLVEKLLNEKNRCYTVQGDVC